MPELPEVETVRRDLADHVVGRTIATVRVGPKGARSVRRYGPPLGLEGRTVEAVGRHGKYLTIRVRPAGTVVVHLRMSGQLLLAPPGSPEAPHTHVVLAFADGGDELRFVDPRTFGEVFVSVGEGVEVPELASLGPDAVGLAPEQIRAMLAGRRVRLKALLLDQRRIAGIGNIYSDEILWRAGLRPLREASTVSKPKATLLAQHIQAVLEEAITLRGSSLSDNQYVDLSGTSGTYQSRHAVYGREGLPCPRCGGPVKRIEFQQRSAHYCPRCQK